MQVHSYNGMRRAVLSRRGRAVQLSRDHKPSTPWSTRPAEAGGAVSPDALHDGASLIQSSVVTMSALVIQACLTGMRHNHARVVDCSAVTHGARLFVRTDVSGSTLS